MNTTNITKENEHLQRTEQTKLSLRKERLKLTLRQIKTKIIKENDFISQSELNEENLKKIFSNLTSIIDYEIEQGLDLIFKHVSFYTKLYINRKYSSQTKEKDDNSKEILEEFMKKVEFSCDSENKTILQRMIQLLTHPDKAIINKALDSLVNLSIFRENDFIFDCLFSDLSMEKIKKLIFQVDSSGHTKENKDLFSNLVWIVSHMCYKQDYSEYFLSQNQNFFKFLFENLFLSKEIVFYSLVSFINSSNSYSLYKETSSFLCYSMKIINDQFEFQSPSWKGLNLDFCVDVMKYIVFILRYSVKDQRMTEKDTCHYMKIMNSALFSSFNLYAYNNISSFMNKIDLDLINIFSFNSFSSQVDGNLYEYIVNNKEKLYEIIVLMIKSVQLLLFLFKNKSNSFKNQMEVKESYQIPYNQSTFYSVIDKLMNITIFSFININSLTSKCLNIINYGFSVVLSFLLDNLCISDDIKMIFFSFLKESLIKWKDFSKKEGEILENSILKVTSQVNVYNQEIYHIEILIINSIISLILNDEEKSILKKGCKTNINQFIFKFLNFSIFNFNTFSCQVTNSSVNKSFFRIDFNTNSSVLALIYIVVNYLNTIHSQCFSCKNMFLEDYDNDLFNSLYEEYNEDEYYIKGKYELGVLLSSFNRIVN